MTDLTSNYLGLTLKNPIVPSASPLSKNIDEAVQLEDAGAAAIVMYSLFEEEIKHHQNTYRLQVAESTAEFAESNHFLPKATNYESVSVRYLNQLRQLKQRLDIPVVASINGINTGTWLDIAKEIEAAGADAIEFNLYTVPSNFEASSIDMEHMYIRLFNALREKTTLPIVVKLGEQFTSPGHFIKKLQLAGAQGVSLFNRFYQPDFDLETGQLYPSIQLSGPNDYYQVLHWMALLHRKVDLTLCATTGVHSSTTALKLIGAGADVVHSASSLIKLGPKIITEWLNEMSLWLDENGYESIDDLRGQFSFWQVRDTSVYERINYYQNLSRFKKE